MGAMMVPAATRMPRLAAMVRAEEMAETMGGSMVVALCLGTLQEGPDPWRSLLLFFTGPTSPQEKSAPFGAPVSTLTTATRQ